MRSCLLVLAVLSACGPQPSKTASLRVQNQLVEAQLVLLKVRYLDALSLTPLPPEAESEPLAVTAGFDYGYALARPIGEEGLPMIIRTNVKRGSTAFGEVIVAFEDSTYTWSCSGLSQAEYAEIHDRAFAEDAVRAFTDITCN